jgi:DNA-binding response OmpR family regulator
MKSRILVVDEAADSAALFQHGLSRNYEVRVARNAKQGLELALRFVPQLVILDLVLPDVNGLEWLVSLRRSQRLSATPVIICSSIPQRNVEQALEGLGVAAYLEKPIDPETVLKIVTGILEAESAWEAYGLFW